MDDLPIPSDARIDLRNRLSYNSKAQGVYSALWELAVLSSLHKTCLFAELYPAWAGSKIPEACVDGLVDGRPTLIEVKSVFGQTLTVEPLVSRARNKITSELRAMGLTDFENVCVHAESFLDFPMRYPGITADFEVDELVKSLLRSWVDGGAMPKLEIRQGHNNLHVFMRNEPSMVVEHCSMPDEIWDLERNRAFEALKGAGKQLKLEYGEYHRCVFLCDAGSTWIKEPKRKPHLRIPLDVKRSRGENFTPREVVEHYFKKHSSIDTVVILWVDEGFRRNSVNSGRVIRYSEFWRDEKEESKIKDCVEKLPVPMYSPYQAAHATLKNGYSPDRIRNSDLVGMRIVNSPDGRVTMTMSKNVLNSILRGDFDHPSIRHMDLRSVPEEYTISGIELKSRSPYVDDDDVVVEFRKDPSSSNFI